MRLVQDHQHRACCQQCLQKLATKAAHYFSPGRLAFTVESRNFVQWDAYRELERVLGARIFLLELLQNFRIDVPESLLLILVFQSPGLRSCSDQVIRHNVPARCHIHRVKLAGDVLNSPAAAPSADFLVPDVSCVCRANDQDPGGFSRLSCGDGLHGLADAHLVSDQGTHAA
ncbi:hypothetical protein D3C78_761380 [compost metagenome]